MWLSSVEAVSSIETRNVFSDFRASGFVLPKRVWSSSAEEAMVEARW